MLFLIRSELMNKPMKLLTLYLFLIFFTLQTSSQADDIRDFQIEGISLGDSALNYIAKDKIYKLHWPGSKKFYYFELSGTKKLDSYDTMSLGVKDRDNKYIIHEVRGFIYYENKIKDCLSKKMEIVEEISTSFKDNVRKEDLGTVKYLGDKSGKSKVTILNFHFNSGGLIHISCYDMKDNSWESGLSINIATQEFYEWNAKEAF